MYGTEINIKITDFEDDEELQEIINWLQYMLNRSKAIQEKRDIERELKRSTSRKKVTLPLSLDTIEESEEESILPQPAKKEEKEPSKVPRVVCICGVDYVAKNKTRHEKSRGHLNYMENKK
jgi:hypothetical protein